MALGQIAPIPVDLDICGSQFDLTLFLQLLNYNFEFIWEQILDTFGVDVQLPGVPEVTIPGYDYQIVSEKQALPVSWVGGRYPAVSPYGKLTANGSISGFSLPGVPPIDIVLKWIMENYQLIADQVPELVDLRFQAQLPIFNPCFIPTPLPKDSIGGVYPTEKGPSSSSVAGTINAINQIILDIITTIEDSSGCPDQAIDDGTWTDSESGGGPSNQIFTDTRYGQERLSTASGSNEIDIDKTIDGSDWGSCESLRATVHLEAALIDVGGGVPISTAAFYVGGFLVVSANQVGLVGVQTINYSITIPIADLPVSLGIHTFMNGNCAGYGFGDITLSLSA